MPNIGSFREPGRELEAEGKSIKEGLLSICIVSFFVLFLLLAGGLFKIPEAFAAVKTWDGGGGDGNWSTAANWSPDGVPALADTITIGSGYTVNIAGNVTNSNTVTVQSGATLNINGGTFTVAGAGSQLVNNGTVNINDPAKLLVLTFNNSNILNVKSNATYTPCQITYLTNNAAGQIIITSTVVRTYGVNNWSALRVDSTLVNAGLIRTTIGDIYHDQNGNVTNTGIIETLGSGDIFFLRLDHTSSFDNNGGIVRSVGTGSAGQWGFGVIDLEIDVTNRNGGKIYNTVTGAESSMVSIGGVYFSNAILTNNNSEIYTTGMAFLSIRELHNENLGKVYQTGTMNTQIDRGYNNNAEIYHLGTNSIGIQGNFSNLNGATIYSLHGSVYVYGNLINDNSSIYLGPDNDNPLSVYGNLTNDNGASFYVENASIASIYSLHVQGTVVNDHGSEIYIATGPGTLQFEGIATNDNASEIRHGGTGPIDVYDIYNYTGSNLVGGSGPWVVKNIFYNDATSTVTATSGTWEQYGEFSNYNPSDAQGMGFYHNFGTINFLGTTTTNIYGSTTFYNFTHNTTKAGALSGHQIVIYNGYIYYVGGYDSDYNAISNVKYAELNADGTFGTLQDATAMDVERVYGYSFAYNGYLYVLGGTDDSSKFNDVQYAPIDPDDGSLGVWSTTTSFAGARSGLAGALDAQNGYVYIAGGSDDVYTNLDDIQYAKINPDGTLGNWQTSPEILDIPAMNSSAVVNNGFLYIMGGYIDNDPSVLNTVYYAEINPANGSLISLDTTTSFDVPRGSQAAVAHNGYIYVIAGDNHDDAQADIQLAHPNADGTITSWSATTSLPTKAYDEAAAVDTATNRLYVTRGDSYTFPIQLDYFSTINGNGTLGAWAENLNSPTDLVFESGTTQTIVGELNIRGNADVQPTLSSSESGVQFNIDPQGSINVSYVKVIDSNNLNGVNIDPVGGVNLGNTTNWFTPPVYTITSSAGSGGNISPTGTTSINEHESQTYTITPSSGYYVASLVIDETPSPAAASYTFSNVTGSHTIQAVFCGGAGPCMVDNINGSNASRPNNFINLNGSTYFMAADGDTGNKLWKTDGSQAGTEKVINSITLGRIDKIGELLYMSADDGVHGTELWISDGTAVGTHMVKDINLSGNSYPGFLTEMSGSIYFYADDGVDSIWKSDGTEAGTVKVRDIHIPNPGYFVKAGNTIYFNGYTAANGFELWKTDGTTAGTVMVRDIVVGNGSSDPANLFVYNNEVYFMANVSGFGFELWKSDGTSGGTTRIDLNPGANGSSPTGFAIMNDILYFNAYSDSSSYELWRTDGTAGGTYQVKDINESGGSEPKSITVGDGIIYFFADDGIHGPELWMSNGTEIGTTMVEDINPGDAGSMPNEGMYGGLSYTSYLNGKLYFSAADGIHGTELWVTDGTAINTEMIKDIRSGSADSNPKAFYAPDADLILFNATDGINDEELWFYNPNYVAPQYTITATSGAGGSISPSGDATLDSGTSQTYTITPNSGYHIEGVLVDGSSVGAVSSYTFSNIAENHMISVTFALDDEPVVPPVFPPVVPPITPPVIPPVTPPVIPPVEKNYANIVIVESENGSIVPNTLDTKIEEGKIYIFTVTPAPGYELENIYDNGISILNDKCSFEDGVASCTLTIGEESVLGNPFITTHEISANYKEIPEENKIITTEPTNESKNDINMAGFFAGMIQGTKDVSVVVANAFVDVVKQTPPPVAYAFPWLLFILLAYLMYRLAKQARQEGESAGKLLKLIEFDKNVGIQKDNFIMLSSHYLRTPLTIITAGIDLLFTLEKTASEKTDLVKRALAGLNAKVESIFHEISANKYLQAIDATNIKEEKIKIYSSPFLWLPIILIGGIAVLADFLFIKVANININLINLLTEMVVFIIVAQFFISFFRKRQNERKKNLKERTELKKQQVLDDARNNFMKEIVETLSADVAALEIALAQTGSDKNKKEINKGIGDLKQMIRKFGFLASLEAGKAQLGYRNVSIKNAFSDFVEAKDEQIKVKNLRIDMPSNDLSLNSDPEKLIFVIEGLIDNAIKFSQEGGQIDIDWQEKKEGIEISVSDNGVGMTDEAKELLFKPFTRGTSTLQFDYEGMGTNLYIAKMITNYLGGDITVESKVGKGTKVKVEIEK